jgi:hypothetical protein
MEMFSANLKSMMFQSVKIPEETLYDYIKFMICALLSSSDKLIPVSGGGGVKR